MRASTAKVVLVGGGPELRPAILNCPARARIDCVEVNDPRDLLTWLRRGSPSVDAVVLGRGLRDPLSVAQRVHVLDRNVSIILVSEPGREEQIRRAVKVSPFFGEEERCRLIGQKEDLGGAVAAECARARRRRNASRRADGKSSYVDLLLTIVEGASEPIFLKDLAGRYVVMNPACARVFGGTPDRFIGATNVELMSPEVAEELCGDDLQVVESGEAKTFERVLTIRGVTRVYLTTKAPWRDHQGRIVGVIGIARDITERKLREDARYHRSQEAIRARDEFFSIASHELKTPLTAFQLELQAILQALERGTGSLNPERIRGMVERAERQGDRLVKLVNDMLDVSRMKAGQLALRQENVDLAAVVRSAIDRLPEEGPRCGITVEVPGRGPIVGRWDPGRIEQVVTNLLTNAIKYGRGKPVSVTVERRDTTAWLVVRDGGIGMSAEFLRRAFQPFEREPSSGASAGLGLGLYITRQIVEAHGGAIHVDSTPGVGSTFVVELPCADGSASEARSP